MKTDTENRKFELRILARFSYLEVIRRKRRFHPYKQLENYKTRSKEVGVPTDLFQASLVELGNLKQLMVEIKKNSLVKQEIPPTLGDDIKIHDKPQNDKMISASSSKDISVSAINTVEEACCSSEKDCKKPPKFELCILARFSYLEVIRRKRRFHPYKQLENYKTRSKEAGVPTDLFQASLVELGNLKQLMVEIKKNSLVKQEIPPTLGDDIKIHDKPQNDRIISPTSSKGISVSAINPVEEACCSAEKDCKKPCFTENQSEEQENTSTIELCPSIQSKTENALLIQSVSLAEIVGQVVDTLVDNVINSLPNDDDKEICQPINVDNDISHQKKDNGPREAPNSSDSSALILEIEDADSEIDSKTEEALLRIGSDESGCELSLSETTICQLLEIDPPKKEDKKVVLSKCKPTLNMKDVDDKQPEVETTASGNNTQLDEPHRQLDTNCEQIRSTESDDKQVSESERNDKTAITDETITVHDSLTSTTIKQLEKVDPVADDTKIVESDIKTSKRVNVAIQSLLANTGVSQSKVNEYKDKTSSSVEVSSAIVLAKNDSEPCQQDITLQTRPEKSQPSVTKEARERKPNINKQLKPNENEAGGTKKAKLSERKPEFTKQVKLDQTLQAKPKDSKLGVTKQATPKETKQDIKKQTEPKEIKVDLTKQAKPKENKPGVTEQAKSYECKLDLTKQVKPKETKQDVNKQAEPKEIKVDLTKQVRPIENKPDVTEQAKPYECKLDLTKQAKPKENKPKVIMKQVTRHAISDGIKRGVAKQKEVKEIKLESLIQKKTAAFNPKVAKINNEQNIAKEASFDLREKLRKKNNNIHIGQVICWSNKSEADINNNLEYKEKLENPMATKTTSLSLKGQGEVIHRRIVCLPSKQTTYDDSGGANTDVRPNLKPQPVYFERKYDGSHPKDVTPKPDIKPAPKHVGDICEAFTLKGKCEKVPLMVDRRIRSRKVIPQNPKYRPGSKSIGDKTICGDSNPEDDAPRVPNKYGDDSKPNVESKSGQTDIGERNKPGVNHAGLTSKPKCKPVPIEFEEEIKPSIGPADMALKSKFRPVQVTFDEIKKPGMVPKPNYKAASVESIEDTKPSVNNPAAMVKKPKFKPVPITFGDTNPPRTDPIAVVSKPKYKTGPVKFVQENKSSMKAEAVAAKSKFKPVPVTFEKESKPTLHQCDIVPTSSDKTVPTKFVEEKKPSVTAEVRKPKFNPVPITFDEDGHRKIDKFSPEERVEFRKRRFATCFDPDYNSLKKLKQRY